MSRSIYTEIVMHTSSYKVSSEAEAANCKLNEAVGC